MAPVLEEHRLVFGIHFEAPRDDSGVVIVLECLPFPQTLEAVAAELSRIIASIPARPRQTKVEIAPPQTRITTTRR
jgi:hypothetical protein